MHGSLFSVGQTHAEIPRSFLISVVSNALRKQPGGLLNLPTIPLRWVDNTGGYRNVTFIQ